MFDLPHVAARIYGVPLLVSKPKLDTILAALGPRLLTPEGLPKLEDNRPKPAASRFATLQTRAGTPVTDNGIAVVPIIGTMVRRGAFLDSLSGLTSYAWVEDRARQAFADPQVRAVVAELDTNGGEAGGVFDLADALRSMAEESGKPFWAVANENALSAGYAIASAADQIWVTRTGEVGSIGVVLVHVDQSAKNAKDGLAVTYVFAGDHKVDGNPHQPLPDGVRADLQADIDGLYAMFVDQVATARGLSADAVRGTQARIFRGSDAVDAGLADDVGTMADALEALAQTLDGVRAPRAVRTGGRSAASPSTERGTQPMAENAKPGAEGGDTQPTGTPETPAAAPETTTTATEPETPAEGAAAEGGETTETAEAAAAATAPALTAAEGIELAEIAARAARLGVTVDLPKAMREGVKPAALNARVLEELAAKAGAQDAVVSTARTTPAEGETAGAGWEKALTAATPQTPAANGGWTAALGGQK